MSMSVATSNVTVLAVVVTRRRHVDTVLDAVDLFFKRLGNRFSQHGGAGAGIRCFHTDRGWRNVGRLFDRKEGNCQTANEHNHDGDDHREDRAIDKETAH